MPDTSDTFPKVLSLLCFESRLSDFTMRARRALLSRVVPLHAFGYDPDLSGRPGGCGRKIRIPVFLLLSDYAKLAGSSVLK